MQLNIGFASMSVGIHALVRAIEHNNIMVFHEFSDLATQFGLGQQMLAIEQMAVWFVRSCLRGIPKYSPAVEQLTAGFVRSRL